MSRSAPALVVVAGPALDADRLGRGDLHVVDVVPVPDRLEQDIGEAEGEDVLNRFLPEVVIDAIDLPLGERVRHLLDQLAGGLEVVTERFFDDDALPALARLERNSPGARRPPAASSPWMIGRKKFGDVAR